jgi:carboxymethylenebutenolidase
VHGAISCRELLDGAAPATADVPKIKAAMLLNFAEQDPNILGRWPDYEAALKANHVKYEASIYPKTYHGFHNDTTPRMTKPRQNSLGNAPSTNSTRR